MLEICKEIFAKSSPLNTVKNVLIMLKKSATNALKIPSKKAIQKPVDLINNKIADKITKVISSSPQSSLEKYI